MTRLTDYTDQAQRRREAFAAHSRIVTAVFAQPLSFEPWVSEEAVHHPVAVAAVSPVVPPPSVARRGARLLRRALALLQAEGVSRGGPRIARAAARRLRLSLAFRTRALRSRIFKS